MRNLLKYLYLLNEISGKPTVDCLIEMRKQSATAQWHSNAGLILQKDGLVVPGSLYFVI